VVKDYVNPIGYLDRACGIAFAISKADQPYHLAALGLRADGKLVHATNKAVRAPSKFPERIQETHAEYRLCKKIDVGATVFVARSTAYGEWAMSKPCETCERAMRLARVKKVYYTIARGEYGVLKLY